MGLLREVSYRLFPGIDTLLKKQTTRIGRDYVEKWVAKKLMQITLLGLATLFFLIKSYFHWGLLPLSVITGAFFIHHLHELHRASIHSI